MEIDGREEILWGVNELMGWNESMEVRRWVNKAGESGIVSVLNEKLQCNVKENSEDQKTQITADTAYELYNQICLAIKSGKITYPKGKDYFQMVSHFSGNAIMSQPERFDNAVEAGRKLAQALLKDEEIREIIQSGRSKRVGEPKSYFGKSDIYCLTGYTDKENEKIIIENIQKMLGILCKELEIDTNDLTISVQHPQIDGHRVDYLSTRDIDFPQILAKHDENWIIEHFHMTKKEAWKMCELKRHGMYSHAVLKDGHLKGEIELFPNYKDNYISFLSHALLHLCTYKQYQDYAALRKESGNDAWCEKDGKIPEEVMIARFTHAEGTEDLNNYMNLFEQEKVVFRTSFMHSLEQACMYQNTPAGRKFQDMEIGNLSKPCSDSERKHIEREVSLQLNRKDYTR